MNLVEIYGSENISYYSRMIYPIERSGFIFRKVARNMHDKSIRRMHILFS